MTDPRDDDMFNDARVERREHLSQQGENPYPNEVDSDMPLGEVRETYTNPDSFPETPLTVAGRITRINDIGSLAFVDIRDESDTIQLMLTEDDTNAYEAFDDVINHGDFIEATGSLGRSNTDELTLTTTSYDVVSVAVRDPPAGELSPQRRVRNRAGAMLSEGDTLDESVRTRFEVTQHVRQHLTREGYLEVETPILHNRAGGADATPFQTHSDATDTDLYLRIAPELYLKRLLVGGFEQVFEVARVFRNESIDTTHNPEFTMLELYQAYSDYEDMMTLTETLVSTVIEDVTGSPAVEYEGETIDFSPPWEQETMYDLVSEAVGYSVSDVGVSRLRESVEEYVDDANAASLTHGECVLELYEELVEDTLTQPTFVVDHPTESTPLCKTHRDDDGLVERFEAVVAGVELANSYTELNDPIAQIEAFIEQGGEQNIDKSFVETMAYGMPPAAGLGIGIDRLAMLATGETSIRGILAFPMVANQGRD